MVIIVIGTILNVGQRYMMPLHDTMDREHFGEYPFVVLREATQEEFEQSLRERTGVKPTSMARHFMANPAAKYYLVSTD